MGDLCPSSYPDGWSEGGRGGLENLEVKVVLLYAAHAEDLNPRGKKVLDPFRDPAYIIYNLSEGGIQAHSG